MSEHGPIVRPETCAMTSWVTPIALPETSIDHKKRRNHHIGNVCGDLSPLPHTLPFTECCNTMHTMAYRSIRLLFSFLGLCSFHVRLIPQTCGLQGDEGRQTKPQKEKQQRDKIRRTLLLYSLQSNEYQYDSARRKGKGVESRSVNNSVRHELQRLYCFDVLFGSNVTALFGNVLRKPQTVLAAANRLYVLPFTSIQQEQHVLCAQQKGEHAHLSPRPPPPR